MPNIQYPDNTSHYYRGIRSQFLPWLGRKENFCTSTIVDLVIYILIWYGFNIVMYQDVLKWCCFLRYCGFWLLVTSSNGDIFRVTGHLCGHSPVPGIFHAQRPVTRSFHVLFDLRLNKRLSKQWWGWWFETPSRPLWRHRSVKIFAAHIVWLVYILSITIYLSWYCVADNSGLIPDFFFIYHMNWFCWKCFLFKWWWQHQR